MATSVELPVCPQCKHRHCHADTWPAAMDSRTAAAYLGIGERTLRDWVHEGSIAHVRFGTKMLRFRRATLDEFILASEVAAS